MLSVHIIIAPVQCELSPQLMIMCRRSTRLGESTAAEADDYSGMIKGGQRGGNEGGKTEERDGGWWWRRVEGEGAVLLVIMKDDSPRRIIHQRRRCLSPHFCALLWQ